MLYHVLCWKQIAYAMCFESHCCGWKDRCERPMWVKGTSAYTRIGTWEVKVRSLELHVAGHARRVHQQHPGLGLRKGACGAPESRRSNLHGSTLRARSLRAAEPQQGPRVDMQYDASSWRHSVDVLCKSFKRKYLFECCQIFIVKFDLSISNFY